MFCSLYYGFVVKNDYSYDDNCYITSFISKLYNVQTGNISIQEYFYHKIIYILDNIEIKINALRNNRNIQLHLVRLKVDCDVLVVWKGENEDSKVSTLFTQVISPGEQSGINFIQNLITAVGRTSFTAYLQKRHFNVCVLIKQVPVQIRNCVIFEHFIAPSEEVDHEFYFCTQ